jgi:hypothetical protein
MMTMMNNAEVLDQMDNNQLLKKDPEPTVYFGVLNGISQAVDCKGISGGIWYTNGKSSGSVLLTVALF